MRGYDVVRTLREVVEMYSLNTAIEWRGKRMCYAELGRVSDAVARHLGAAGVANGSIVGVMLENISEMITTVVAVLKAGAAFVVLDPTYPLKRLQAMVSIAAPRAFVVSRERLQTLEESLSNWGGEDACVLVLDEDANDGPSNATTSGWRTVSRGASGDVWDPDGMCYVYFTSGTTGRPKAVAGRYRGLGHFVAWEIRTFRVNHTYRVSQLTPPSFDPFLRDVFVPLCTGGTICIPDSEATIRDVKELIDWIERTEVTLVHCVPSLFRAVVKEELRPGQFHALKHVLIAGEQLFGADVRRWMDVFKSRVQLVNLYGPTETTLAKFCYVVQEGDGDRWVIPVGRPIEGAQAVVLGEDGQVCPLGVIGEIYIRTPFRSLGYYRQPELTGAVFVRNPFSQDPSDVIYRTGDLGRIRDDGNLELLGRLDQQVKVRGVRIELGEIEALLRAHPAVVDVAVVDKAGANGEKWLCAYVVATEEVEDSEWRRFLGQYLPDAVLPAAYVKVSALPITPNGKVDRRTLRMRQDSGADGVAYIAPRSPLEAELAALWEHVLGVERVGIHDNFFVLGGHSLLATQVVGRMRETYGVELSLRALFEGPTVAELALAITSAVAEVQEPEALAALLTELERVPEDEVARMLAGGKTSGQWPWKVE